jgi:hypothetical protein
MKTKFFRSLVLLAALSLTTISFSSCNRGYGCPTNFSIGSVLSAAGAAFAASAED